MKHVTRTLVDGVLLEIDMALNLSLHEDIVEEAGADKYQYSECK